MAKRTYAAIDFVSHADNDYNVIPDDDSTPNPASTRKKLRWQLKYVPWALTVERISVFISFVCLVTAIAAAANRSDFKVRISRETLLFFNDTDAQDGMRLLHSTWNNQCNEKYPLHLQEPTWRENETGVVMHSSIYATDIYIFPLTLVVFTTSILFQGWRC